MIVFRILAVVIGYIFGLFQTGYLYGKSKGVDIREHGSGNSGTTNTLRTLGIKAGLVTFVGDLLKAILAVAVVRFLFLALDPDTEPMIKVFEMYAGLGAVLGHKFPVTMKFKGGKGIACTAGVILAVCFPAAPLCLLLFILAVAITRYVSLGSILVVTAFLIQALIYNQLGYLHVPQGNVLEFNILVGCFTAMAIWRHRANIVRLLNGTENKLGKKAE